MLTVQGKRRLERAGKAVVGLLCAPFVAAFLFAVLLVDVGRASVQVIRDSASDWRDEFDVWLDWFR